MLRHVLYVLPLFFLSFSAVGQQMDNEKLEEALLTLTDTLLGGNGIWQLLIAEVPMICVTDEANDRMRIMAPVIERSNLTDKQLVRCMEANLHSALDVRYALDGDFLWVAYIHPLRALSKEQVIDAVKQVYTANMSFGTTYHSTDLLFPKNEKKKGKSGKS